MVDFTRKHLNKSNLVSRRQEYHRRFLLARLTQQIRSHLNLYSCLHRLCAGSCLSCISRIFALQLYFFDNTNVNVGLMSNKKALNKCIYLHFATLAHCYFKLHGFTTIYYILY